MYTTDTEVPLHEVLTNMKNKENGNPTTLSPTKATTEELRNYLAEVLPNYDRDRVYPSDIRKLISWYNILVKAGITELTPTEEAPAAEQNEE